MTVTVSNPRPDGWPFRHANEAPPPQLQAAGLPRASFTIRREGEYVIVSGLGPVRLDSETARVIGEMLVAAANDIAWGRVTEAVDATLVGSTIS